MPSAEELYAQEQLENAWPVGHIVYMPYAPLHYGKVIDVKLYVAGSNKPLPGYTIRWKDGTENVVMCFHLKSLEELIADHEKKLKGHKARLAKAQQEIRGES